MAEAREALKGEDLDRMKRAQQDLTQASHKLAEIMYREAQAQAGGAKKDGGQPGAPKEGEVVDADFEDLGDKK
jgi:molecular chaperone DnaK